MKFPICDLNEEHFYKSFEDLINSSFQEPIDFLIDISYLKHKKGMNNYISNELRD